MKIQNTFSRQLINLIFVSLFILLTTSTNLAQNSVYQLLNGAWQGNIAFNFSTNESGAIVLIVENEEIIIQYFPGCYGKWQLRETKKNKLTFVEQLEASNIDKPCQMKNGGEVIIEPLDSDQLRYSYKPIDSKKSNRFSILKRTARTNVRKPTRPKIKDSSAETGHPTGDLLLELPKYKVYRYSKEELCHTSSSNIAVIADLQPNEPLRLSTDILTNQILPVIGETCDDQNRFRKMIFVYYFLKNAWFFKGNSGGEIYVEGNKERGQQENERAFVSLVYKKSESNPNSWEVYGDKSGIAHYFLPDKGPFDPESKAVLQDWSLSAVRKIMADQKTAYDARIAEQKRRYEEEQRMAPIIAQQQLQKRREGNIAAHAEVLRYFKKESPVEYDFTGYDSKEFLENVYRGKFELFNGDYKSYEEFRRDMLNQTLSNMDIRNPFGTLFNMADVTVKTNAFNARRDALIMSYYTYHLTYLDECKSSKEMEWDISDLVEFYQTLGGKEVEGSRKLGKIFLVRKPFLDSFTDSYVKFGNSNNISPTPPAALQSDYRKFLRTEGCSSPALRFFETNLYLVINWALPVQELKAHFSAEFLKKKNVNKEVPANLENTESSKTQRESKKTTVKKKTDTKTIKKTNKPSN